MGRALSNDLRSRILKAASDESSARSAGIRFGISAATAIRWFSHSRDGELEARLPGGRRGSRLHAHEDFIVGMIEDRKDITLNEWLHVWMKNVALPIKKTAHALEQEQLGLMSRLKIGLKGRCCRDQKTGE